MHTWWMIETQTFHLLLKQRVQWFKVHTYYIDLCQVEVIYLCTVEGKVFHTLSLCMNTYSCHIVIGFQEKWRSHPHQNSEYWWLLWSVWRGEICYTCRIGTTLHRRKKPTQRKEWPCHWAEISTQLCWSYKWKVSL